MPKFSWLPGTVLVEQLIVGRRFDLSHAKRIADQIAGHQDEVGAHRVDDRAKALRARARRLADVRVRGMDERHGLSMRRRDKGEVEDRRGGRVDRPVKRSARPIAVRHAHEDEVRAGVRRESVSATRVGYHDRILVGDRDSRQSRFTRIAPTVSVAVGEDGAGYHDGRLRRADGADGAGDADVWREHDDRREEGERTVQEGTHLRAGWGANAPDSASVERPALGGWDRSWCAEAGGEGANAHRRALNRCRPA